MSVLSKCHLKALSKTMELLIIASLIALIADFFWVLHDILSNGLSLIYTIIASGLLSATAITAVAGLKHHKTEVRAEIKELVAHKLRVQKHKTHHRNCKAK